jgi:hypothetical protein
MSDKGYIVETVDGNTDYAVHVWRLGEQLSSPLWKAPVEMRNSREGGQTEQVVADYPLAFVATDEHLFMGMRSGHVEKLEVRSGRHLGSFGQRKTVVEGMITPTLTPTPIQQLLLFNGKLYDAGLAGLVETETGTIVDDRQIHTAEAYAGRLFMVPSGVNPLHLAGRDYAAQAQASGYLSGGESILRFCDSIRESKAGHLIDAMTKEVVMEDVEPFDGSGYAQGHHVLVDDRVFTHHGNYPYERITIRAFPSGEEIKVVRILTSEGFLEHNGVVYDVRDCSSNADEHRVRVLRSDADEGGQSIYEQPPGTRLLGVVSAGIDGLLVSLFDKQRKTAQLLRHTPDGQSEPLLEYWGAIYITKL